MACAQQLLISQKISGGAGPSSIIEDNFTGSSGSINGRTPDTANTPGHTWVADATASLDGSGLLTINPSASALIDTGMANGYTFEARVRFTGTYYYGFQVNALDANSGWELGLYPNGSYEFYYNENGGYTLVASGSAPTSGSTWMMVKIVVTSTNFSYYVDGSLVNTTARSAGTPLFDAETKVGLLFLDTGDVDWFKIY